MFHATHRVLVSAAAVIALAAGFSGGALADGNRAADMRSGSGIPQLASADFEGSGGRFSFVTASAEAAPQTGAVPAAAVAKDEPRPRDDSFGGFLSSLAGDAVWAIETVVADWR